MAPNPHALAAGANTMVCSDQKIEAACSEREALRLRSKVSSSGKGTESGHVISRSDKKSFADRNANRGWFFHVKKFAWTLFTIPMCRAIVFVLFAVPISFAMDIVSSVRRRMRRFFARPQDHEARVEEVQEQVRQWKQSGSQKTMRSKRAPFLTMSVALRPKDGNFLIDCSKLRDILSIDEERMVARVEPMVDMGTLSSELLPRGLAMAVHIEMEDITVGGLCSGMGMETNSHRVGMIHENILSMDLVLGDGKLVHATRDNEYADLFTCVPWSHGSLGFIVAVELKIVRIKPYIHVTYLCCYSKDSYISKMQELSMSDNAPEFLECTVFSRDTAVIQCGRMADATTKEDKAKINHVNSFWKTWYYVWMESFLERRLEQYDELIPAKHYFHRFSRSIFWELRDMIPFANHPIYRYLMGWMGAPKIKIIKLLTNRKIRWETMYKHVVQDLIVPITDAGELVDKCDEWFGIYPMLFFPLRMLDHGPHQGLLRNPHPAAAAAAVATGAPKHEMYFDLGIYGIPKLVREHRPWDAKATLRKMEAWVRARRGYQALYCDIFQTREEVRSMFDHTLYDQVRAKYNALGAFPELYDKIKPEAWLLEDRHEDDLL